MDFILYDIFIAVIGVLDLISGGSRSTTPTSSLLTRKSPTMDQGIQVGHEQQQQGNNIGKLNDKTNIRTVQPPRRDHDRYLEKLIFFYNKTIKDVRIIIILFLQNSGKYEKYDYLFIIVFLFALFAK